jgi:hypothetical protein
VWLVYANPVHIAQWGVYAYPSEANGKKGILQVEVEVTNGGENTENLTVVNELFDDQGKIVTVRKNNYRLRRVKIQRFRPLFPFPSPICGVLTDRICIRLKPPY